LAIPPGAACCRASFFARRRSKAFETLAGFLGFAVLAGFAFFFRPGPADLREAALDPRDVFFRRLFGRDMGWISFQSYGFMGFQW
jgi:hypothetical protein